VYNIHACIFYDVYDTGILYAQHQMRNTVSALEGVREFICASSQRYQPPLLLQSDCTMSAFGRFFPSNNIWCRLATRFFAKVIPRSLQPFRIGNSFKKNFHLIRLSEISIVKLISNMPWCPFGIGYQNRWWQIVKLKILLKQYRNMH